MSQDPDNFGDLQVLLRWKRYERPPPGYFQNFVPGIIIQIEKINEVNHDPFWVRCLRNFDPKPILVCACGLAVGGTLLFGFSFFGIGGGNSQSFSDSRGAWLAGGTTTPVSVRSYVSGLGSLDEFSGVLPFAPNVAKGTDVPAFLFDGSGLKAQGAKANYLFQER